VETKNLQRELDIGEILSQTFHLYSRNFVQYLIPFLVAGILTGLVTIAVNSAIVIPARPVHATTQQLLANLIATVTSLLLSGIVSWIASSIATGITIKYTSDMLERGQANLQTSFNFTIPKLLFLLAASIIAGILIVLGFVALVVPGVILALMFSLVYPAILLEGKGALGSLSRSRELVSKRWLNTFGLLLLLGIIVVSLLLLLGIIVVIVSGVFGLVAAPFGMLSPLVSAILTAFISPIFAIAITLYYYSMKARTLPLTPPPPPAQTF